MSADLKVVEHHWRDERAQPWAVDTFDFINAPNCRVHPMTLCDGRPCCLHDPSEHSMRDWPMLLRETGLVERICTHGVGHPDPDSAAWANEVMHTDVWGVHGCDGCCREVA